MEIPQNKAFEVIGAQQVEIVVLREHIGMLQGHKCAPCGLEHTNDPQTQEAPEPDGD